MDPAKNGGLTQAAAASFKPSAPAPAPAAASSPASSSTSASSSSASATGGDVSGLQAQVAALTLELKAAKARIAELEAKEGAVKATLEAAV